MSNFLRMICGSCGGTEGLPKASVSTNYSAKNELKLPITSMHSTQNKRFNILSAKHDQMLILEKSIFRILGHVFQTFFNKRGLSKKKKCKSLMRSKISLNSMTLPKQKFSEDFLSELNFKMLMNPEEGFFVNERVLRKFVESFEFCNFAVFYSGSFSIKLLKNLVFFLIFPNNL